MKLAKKKNRDVEKLLVQIKELYEDLRSNVFSRFDRDLPFEELLFDRWQRAKKLGFGKGSSIYHNCYIYSDVKVGKNTWIGPFVILDGSGGLEIGDNCCISSGAQIYSHNTVKWAVSRGKEKYERRSVKIGECCFIGSNSVIRDGITIGKHSIIGANSYVNKDIPENSIAFGNPAEASGKVKVNKQGKVNLEYFNES